MTDLRLDRTTRDALVGRLTRRDALKGAAALGLAMPAIGAVGGRAFAQGETYEVAYLTPGLNVPFWKYLSDGIKNS